MNDNISVTPTTLDEPATMTRVSDKEPSPNHKEVLLAAIPSAQVNSLLKVLAAACAAVYNNGDASPELKKMAKESVSAAHRAALALSSEIVPTLAKIINGDDVDHDELVQAVKELRQGIRYEIKTDRNIDHETLDILGASTAYLINHGEPALRKLQKLVPHLGEKALTQNFIADVASQKDFQRPLQRIVKKVTGKEGSILSQEGVLKLKEKYPDVHREYLRLRKGFNQVWKDEIRNFVFQSKEPTVDYQSVLKYLDKNGIENPLPRGFVGRIDANGGLYTTANKRINGVPGPGFGVQMNPQYNPKTDDQYVFTTIGPDGKISQYVYTLDYRKSANKEKFQKVADLMGNIDAIHKKWLPLLKRQDDSPESVAATILELLYTFSARIGGAGNMADGKPTFGVSTITGKHVTIRPGQILISYKGKDGVQQKHLIQANAGPEAKMLYAQVKRLAEGKGPNDPIFTFASKATGKERVMTGQIVNRLFKALGAKSTIHKVRHVAGTKLFQQLLSENESKIFGRKGGLTHAQADDILKKLATKVGSMLGHVRGVGQQQKATGATAIANYIDPGVIVNYYERLNLRLPRAIAKLAKG